MNYLEMVNNFWRVDQEYLFSGNETRLYFYLLKVSNSLNWKNPFTNADRFTANCVGVSINTLKTCRKRLLDAGLILFTPGGSGPRNMCSYRLIAKNIEVSTTDTINNKTVNMVSTTDTILANELTPQPTPSINNTKTNKTLESKDSINKSASLFQKNEKDKKFGCATADKSIYTQAIALYNSFVKARTNGMGAFINGAEGKSMKNILAYLEQQAAANALSKEDAGSYILNTWAYLLRNWDMLPDFNRSRTKLTEISSDLTKLYAMVHSQEAHTEGSILNSVSKLKLQSKLGYEKGNRNRLNATVIIPNNRNFYD